MKKSKTPTFLLELPLIVEPGQAKRIRAHLEAARCLYTALLGEARKRLRRMRADAGWQAVRSIPRTHKQERNAAFSRLRQQYQFSDYALHAFAKTVNRNWIADHIDAVMAQTLATRVYQAVNRMCLGKAKLYSAFLAAHLDPANPIPSVAHEQWERAEMRVQAAIEVLTQHAKEGLILPRSVGITRAGARLPKSLAPNRQELVFRRDRLETLG